MKTVSESYADALKEFESLTSKRAATLRNKGKEEGLKKLNMLFKSGKSIDERLAIYEAAMLACEKAKTPQESLKAVKVLDVARTKLTEGLKKNIAAFTVEAHDISPSDGDMKTGFEVFIKRMSQVSNRAKMEVEQRKQIALKDAEKLTADGKMKSDIKTVYLNIRKGCDETEALMKVFMARPSKETFMDAFSSGTGPRSISVAVTNWKQIVLKANPTIGERLRADPVHLITNMFDATQRKDYGFWANKLHMDQPGWEAAAKREAQRCLDQVKLWRMMADDMKKLVA